MDLKPITWWALEDVKTSTRITSFRQEYGSEKNNKCFKTLAFMFADERELVCVCDMHFDVCALHLLRSLTGRHAHFMFPVKNALSAAYSGTLHKNMKDMKKI